MVCPLHLYSRNAMGSTMMAEERTKSERVRDEMPEIEKGENKKQIMGSFRECLIIRYIDVARVSEQE